VDHSYDNNSILILAVIFMVQLCASIVAVCVIHPMSVEQTYQPSDEVKLFY